MTKGTSTAITTSASAGPGGRTLEASPARRLLADYAGDPREFKEAQARGVRVYPGDHRRVQVLASQFESPAASVHRHARRVLSFVGALGALVISGMTLNCSVRSASLCSSACHEKTRSYWWIRQQAKAEGKSRSTPSFGGEIRLRPIMMTSISLIFGVLPIAFALGAGSTSRRPLGMAVVGGMNHLDIPYVVRDPRLYSLLDDAREWIKAGARK